MKKLLLVLLLTLASLNAKLCIEPLDKSFLKSKVKIVDIRTKGEWKQTGVVKNSILLTFADETGKYDIKKWATSLQKKLKKGEKFALICRTGSRSNQLAAYIAFQNNPDFVKAFGKNINIIDLKGGVLEAMRLGVKLIPYK